MTASVKHLFVGAPASLPGGEQSAIFKTAVFDSRRLDHNGIAGDTQSDTDRHGGADRALHHFPTEHYAFLSQTLSRSTLDISQLQPGVLGENISTQGLTENDVHVGDIFQLGSAIIQIAQPRQPCWKIGARLGYKPIVQTMSRAGRAGWLYRVIEAGHVQVGDTLSWVERANHSISLAALWACHNATAPNAKQQAQIAFLIAYPLLAESWRKRLSERRAR